MTKIIVVNTWDNVQSACKRILACNIIAFDIEGVNLGRKGLVTLMQIAINESTVFCFDVLILGQHLFASQYLGSVFTSYRILKLCFDCRIDGDVLQSHFGLQLNMLYDVQVLYTLIFQSPKDRFLKGLQHVLKMPGVIEEKEALEKVVQSKNIMKQVFKKQKQQHHTKHIFLMRPLTNDILEYCGSDVIYLLKMYFIWWYRQNPFTVLHLTNARLQNYCNHAESIPTLHMSKIDF